MTEREFIKTILNRLQRECWEDSTSIQFHGDGYEDIVVEFDKDGLVIAIY